MVMQTLLIQVYPCIDNLNENILRTASRSGRIDACPSKFSTFDYCFDCFGPLYLMVPPYLSLTGQKSLIYLLQCENNLFAAYESIDCIPRGVD